MPWQICLPQERWCDCFIICSDLQRHMPPKFHLTSWLSWCPSHSCGSYKHWAGAHIAYRAVTTCKCSLFSDGRFSRIMSTCPIYHSLTELYNQYAGSIERKITQICVLSKYISRVYVTLHCSYKNRGRFAGMLKWAVFLWVFLNLEPFTLWVTGHLSTALLYVYFPADYKTYKASGFSRMKGEHQ